MGMGWGGVGMGIGVGWKMKMCYVSERDADPINTPHVIVPAPRLSSRQERRNHTGKSRYI